jgi:hypothetical protein
MLPVSSPSSSEVSKQIVNAYGTREQFLVTFNPDAQRTVTSDVCKCLFANFPTLAQVNATYSRQTAEAWLTPQLYDLSEYCGCREKLKGRPLEQLAEIIAQDFHYLKISEIMLFLRRFKAGRYGHFYGSVDPLVIVTALRTFLAERAEAYTRRESLKQQQRYDAYRREAITYEEYLNHKQHVQEKT